MLCNVLIFQANNSDKAFEYIELSRKMLTLNDFDEPLYDVIITTCAMNGAWELSLSFLNQYLSSYVSSISGGSSGSKRRSSKSSRGNSKSPPQELVSEHKQSTTAATIDNKMFNQVLHGAAKHVEVDVMLLILDCMIKGRFGDFGDFEECKVRIKIPKPCSISYNAILEAYKRNRDINGALKFFREKFPQELHDVTSYNSLMWNAQLSGNFILVLELYQEAKERGLSPDFISFK
jgi:pentatricopeptide repeat protein